MTRALYRGLLQLHPPAFRRQFAAEMLWIFDEAAASQGALLLLLDLALSVARQWFLRAGVWKVALALIGACLQVGVSGLTFIAAEHPHHPAARAAGMTPAMNDLIQVTLWSVGFVFAAVFGSALWVARFNRSKRPGDFQRRRTHTHA